MPKWLLGFLHQTKLTDRFFWGKDLSICNKAQIEKDEIGSFVQGRNSVELQSGPEMVPELTKWHLN